MVLPTLEEETGVRVDSIFSFSPYEKKAIERARCVLLGEFFVNFAAPEDVIIHKIFAHRPRDIEDGRIILFKNSAIDRGYIKKWLSDFDAANPDEGLAGIFEDLLQDLNAS